MCGLAAIFGYGAGAPPVDGGELLAMRAAMVARGPDGAGEWLSADGQVGLAHRRLSIIDTSAAAAQPMADTQGGLRLVFNGEIYNFKALRAELEQQGAVFRTRSDSEVLLELYRRDGAAMVERLRGMFAFALWDGERRGLLLARDAFGIKPLYFADDGRTLRVASQVKALLAGGGVDTAPEPAGHAGFFLWGHVPEPFTLYKSIRALAAGTTLWLGADGAREERRFFDLAAEMRAAGPAADADGDALRAALADSVAHHLVADVPVGVFLSSGLDSATIAALASEAAGGPLSAVTLGFAEFAGTAHDEVPLAQAVAHLYGAEHRVERVTVADFAAARPAILAAMDQPSVDGVNTWFVAGAARRGGLKVALSGLGGDELFAGYSSFRDIPRLVHALAPLRVLPALGRGFRWATAGWIGRFASPKAAGLLELGTTLADAYLLRRGMAMPWELPRLMDPEMARHGWRDLAMPGRLAAAVAGVPGERLQLSALEMGFYMRNQLLRDADWAGMAHSLEIRVPLIDVTLLRAVLPLVLGPHPPGKREMAAAARPALPAAVLERAKTGFVVPVADWVGGGRGLRGWAGQVHTAFA